MKELLGGLFPSHVLVASARLDPESLIECAFAEEAAHVANAIHQRQAEYAAGRRLAHGLLDQLREAGTPMGQRAPLVTEQDRGPNWPAGTTGSITHTIKQGHGICLVAVAAAHDEPRLGLDVEPAVPLKEKLWPAVLTVSERALLTGLGGRGKLLSKVYFSAKEAVYKMVSRDVGRVLEFAEVEISLSMVRGTFDARFILKEPPLVELPKVEGRWALTKEFIVTSTVGR